MKTIYINHYAPNIHSLYYEMLQNPPEWFRYLLKNDLHSVTGNKIINSVYSLNKSELFWKFNKRILSNFINTVKIKDFLYPYFVIPKKNIDLVYSMWYIVKKNIPWVIDMETLHVLNWYNIPDLEKNREYYKKHLEHTNCKWIIVWNTKIYESVDSFFDSEIIRNKMVIIRHTIKSNEFTREKKENNVINLSFLWSWNILRASYIRWIKDALLIYKKLTEKYTNISLTIAPFLPIELEEEFWSLPGLIVKNKVLDRNEMSDFYKNTDILLHPSYANPAMTLLEAMNFWVPIITTNYYGLSDLVKDWINWLICKNNSLFEYYDKYSTPVSDIWECVMKYSWKDLEMIDDFVEKASYLIDNPDERMRLWINWKKTLLEGEYNFEHSNNLRKKIFSS